MKTLFLGVAALMASSGVGAADEPPVAISIVVDPTPVAAGSEASVKVTLKPQAGIKLNKYPKTKLVIGASAGLVAGAEGAIGTSRPPPADQLEANYYKGAVEPLVVPMAIDAAATSGRHDVPAKLSYFYCVAASGYCAPAKLDVSIPLIVR